MQSFVSRLICCVGLLSLQSGCLRVPAVAAVPTPLQFSGLVTTGVRQVVTLSPREPATGDTVHIRTTLRNETDARITLNVTDDPMADGTLVVRIPGDRIFLRSGGQREIAPHDSVVAAFRGIVDSPPGVYNLTVRHVTGGARVDGFVTVRARGKAGARPANDR